MFCFPVSHFQITCAFQLFKQRNLKTHLFDILRHVKYLRSSRDNLKTVESHITNSFCSESLPPYREAQKDVMTFGQASDVIGLKKQLGHTVLMKSG